MSKCPRCGHSPRINPFSPLLACSGQLMMLWFLNHVTPEPGSWGGAPDFFINFHWFMWWFNAIFAAFSAVVFFSAVGVLVADSHEHAR